MKIMKKTVWLSLLMILALALAACGGSDPETPAATAVPEQPTAVPMTAEPTAEPTAAPVEETLPNIVEIAVADGRFTTLVTAVTAAGLAEALQGEGPFTVFAPTDDAFAALPAGTIEALLADIPTLTDILLYHVVSGAVFAADVVTLDSATTLLDEDVTITVDNGAVFINDAQVIITDIEASNGVIHVIDAVLLPSFEDAELPNIVEIAVADGRFTTLVTAVTEAGLAEALQGEGPFTVFAPTDDAFAALPDGTVEALLADIPTLTDILFYHVIAGAAVFAEEVVELSYAETALGFPVIVTVTDDGVFINDAQVIITDIEASNGVIHVIDAVILPPTTDIVETAVEAGVFTTLATALTEADLIDALQGEGPFTVFAPTDDAFELLPDGLLEALLADIPTLTDILLYHVVEGWVFAADVVQLEMATTLLGEDVTITIDEDGDVFINDAQIIVVNILTTNGVIHVIDAVLVP
jgi:transforming growth factor-beta-induced protein